MTIKAIDTGYAGCRFRSRLEARWAVFFDYLGIRWEYEPQGFSINGRPYLPDFRIEGGTWVEVKGDPDDLDTTLMLNAAWQLPRRNGLGASPQLLILGPIPAPLDTDSGDWGWVGLNPAHPDDVRAGQAAHDDVFDTWYGFGHFRSKRRLWALYNTSCGTPVMCGDEASDWLLPAVDSSEPGVPDAYRAARSARFSKESQ